MPRHAVAMHSPKMFTALSCDDGDDVCMSMSHNHIFLRAPLRNLLTTESGMVILTVYSTDRPYCTNCVPSLTLDSQGGEVLDG